MIIKFVVRLSIEQEKPSSFFQNFTKARRYSSVFQILFYTFVFKSTPRLYRRGVYSITYGTMAWKKINIQRENGEWVDAQAPEIISASRSTDIPAFYADWFFHRLEIGYSAWRNPFNGVNSYVSYKNTRFIVFWSKNPKPLLQHLPKLKSHSPKIECYIQYTLNDYVAEGLEKGVPPLDERIETFKTLVEKLGKGRVIWRFDPLILTDRISQNDLLRKIDYIGDRLLVFSFYPYKRSHFPHLYILSVNLGQHGYKQYMGIFVICLRGSCRILCLLCWILCGRLA